VTLCLLGRFVVEVDGAPAPAEAWRRRHAAALVKLLALTPRHTLHREQVVDVLWPELSVDEAAPRLYKAAHFVRKATGGGTAVVVRNDVVQLFPHATVSVDAAMFETEATAALAAGDPVAAAAAADRYGGDLLPEDLYEPWITDARERLRILYLRVLRLAERWEELVAADPTDEAACVALMRRQAERDDWQGALHQYARHERVLRDQLDVTPGAEAVALRDEARRALDAARVVGAPGTGGAVDAAAPAGVAGEHSPAAPAAPPDTARGAGATSAQVAASGAAGEEPVQPVLAQLWSSPLLGRDEELAAALSTWRPVVAGEPGFTIVGGDPGIGKTTLAAHVARRCRADGGRVLLGRCDEDGAVPYQPFAEAVRHWATADPAGAAALPPEVAARLALLAPTVPALAGASTTAAAVGAPTAGNPSDDQRQELFHAVATWLELVTASRPTLLLLDDLHWADEATLLLVRFLVRHPPRAAVLVLVTYRPAALAVDHPFAALLADTRGRPGVERIDLSGIAVDAVERLIAAAAGSATPAVPAADTPLHHAGPAAPAAGRSSLAAELQHRTGGNPLFVRLVLRHLADRGALPAAGGGAVASLDGLGAPAGVTEVVERQLSSLPSEVAAVVRTAAVLGPSFDLRVLGVLLERADDDVISALEDARRAGFVVDVPGEVDRYRFVHALVRQAIEETVPASRRVRIHWQAGHAIARVHGDGVDEHLDEIAHHLVAGVAAGDRQVAARAAVRAGEASLRLLAFERARTHFGQGIALLDDVRRPDPDLVWEALHGRGEATGALLDAVSPADHLRAAAVARAQGRVDRFVRSVLGVAFFQLPGRDDRTALDLIDEALAAAPADAHGDRVELLAARAMQSVARNESAEASDAADRAVARARRADDPAALATALSARCYTLLGSPAVEELRRTAVEAVARRLPPEGRLVTPHFAPGFVAMQRGDRVGVDQATEDVLAAAAQRRSSTLRVVVMMWRAALALAEGRFEESRALAAAARAASTAPAWIEAAGGHVVARRIETGREDEVVGPLAAFVDLMPRAHPHRAMLANLLLARGDEAAAREHLRVLEDAAWPVDGWASGIALRHLAEVAVRLPHPDLAEALLPRAAAYSGQLLPTFLGVTIEAAADRCRGQLLLALGRPEEAVAACDAARALEDRFGASALSVRTASWQARARLAVGGGAAAREARDLAGEATARAERLGMATLLAELRALPRR
jgi:DNA-binding SARP family transcriptional activator/tetratricopeptide (TPR) repeat protein